MKRLLLIAVLVMIPFGAGAEDPGERLADRIPTVTHRKMSKRKRVEWAAGLGTMLNDPFYSYGMLGAGVGYHFNESLGLRFSGTYLVAKPAYPRVVVGGLSKLPVYNRPLLDAVVELEWAPVYGRLSLLGGAFLSFDGYLLAGGGLSADVEGELAGVATVGLGQRYRLGDAATCFWEIRGRAFEMNRLTGSTQATPRQYWGSVTLGVMFYLPTMPLYQN